MWSYISGLYPPGTSRTISPPTRPFSSDNQKCPQTLPNVPKEAKSLLAENHCYINVMTIIIGQRQFPRFLLVVVEVVKHPLSPSRQANRSGASMLDSEGEMS